MTRPHTTKKNLPGCVTVFSSFPNFLRFFGKQENWWTFVIKAKRDTSGIGSSLSNVHAMPMSKTLNLMQVWSEVCSLPS